MVDGVGWLGRRPPRRLAPRRFSCDRDTLTSRVATRDGFPSPVGPRAASAQEIRTPSGLPQALSDTERALSPRRRAAFGGRRGRQRDVSRNEPCSQTVTAVEKRRGARLSRRSDRKPRLSCAFTPMPLVDLSDVRSSRTAAAAAGVGAQRRFSGLTMTARGARHLSAAGPTRPLTDTRSRRVQPRS